MRRKGMLVIISGPSGSGKGTVVKKLNRDDFALSISMTTRAPRPGEVDGKDYFFTSKEDFIHYRDSGQLLEHAEFVGNMYGTPKEYVEKQVQNGKAVFLEIDVMGALQIKEKFQDSISIFLVPPSAQELASRLIGRNTDAPDVILRRLKRAKQETEYIPEYDYLVVNDDIDDAVSRIYTIIDSEYSKPHRNQEFITNIQGDDFDATSILFGTNDTTQ